MKSDWKKEIDEEAKRGRYIARKALVTATVIIVILAVVFGGIGLVGKWVRVRAEREIFIQSKQYTEGLIDDLADYKFQYETADDEIEEKAIADLIRSRFANFDSDIIKNDDLKYFLEKIRRNK